MTTLLRSHHRHLRVVVEAYRLDRYDNYLLVFERSISEVVEAYRLDRYDNLSRLLKK